MTNDAEDLSHVFQAHLTSGVGHINPLFQPTKIKVIGRRSPQDMYGNRVSFRGKQMHILHAQTLYLSTFQYFGIVFPTIYTVTVVPENPRDLATTGKQL